MDGIDDYKEYMNSLQKELQTKGEATLIVDKFYENKFGKENWNKIKFDEEITAIVDSYYRDACFALIPDLKLEFIHDETAIFHLSGQDFMQQEQEGTDKHKRLIEDLIKLAKKYEFCRHALVFSYRKEFDKTIAELNIPFKEIFEKWKTPFMLKYYHDREKAKETYGIEI